MKNKENPKSEIKYFNVRDLRNSEFIYYMNSVIVLLKSKNIHPKIYEVCSQMESTLRELNGIKDWQMQIETNNMLKEAAKYRKHVLVGLGMQIKAFRKHYKPEVVNKGNLLWRAYTRFGTRIYLQNQLEQTDSIEIITDSLLHDDKYRETVEELGIVEWVEELEKANVSYGQNFIKHLKEITDKKPVLNVVKLRDRLSKQYFQLTTVIKSIAILDTDNKQLSEAISFINTEIKGYHKLLANRKARKEVRNARMPEESEV